MLKVAARGYIRRNDLLSRESLLLEEFLRDMASDIVRLCQFCGQCYETTPVEAVPLNDVKGLHCCPIFAP
jgi:hypothetical protein